MVVVRKSTYCWIKYYFFLISLILHPKIKLNVTISSSNQKRDNKTDGIFFFKCISSVIFHDITIIYELKLPDRTWTAHLGAFQNTFWLQNHQKLYFYPILMVVIRINLLPEFESNTFVQISSSLFRNCVLNF